MDRVHQSACKLTRKTVILLFAKKDMQLVIADGPRSLGESTVSMFRRNNIQVKILAIHTPEAAAISRKATREGPAYFRLRFTNTSGQASFV